MLQVLSAIPCLAAVLSVLPVQGVIAVKYVMNGGGVMPSAERIANVSSGFLYLNVSEYCSSHKMIKSQV